MFEHKVICNDKALQFHTENLVLHSLLKILPVNFMWCDEKGYVIGCNESAMKFFEHHLKVSDLIGRNLENIVTKEAWDNTKRVIATGESLLIEECHHTDKGDKIYFLSMKSPLLREGKISGAVIIAVDITDKKRTEIELIQSREALLLANEAKKEFLENIRHDLRLPFSGILGLSQLLESKETDPAKKESLRDIVQSSELLLNHINDIMSYIELENGYLPSNRKEFDITKALQDIFTIMVPAAKDKKLDLLLRIDREFTHNVIGDEVRLQRILMNIIANAIKFTDKGFVTITGNWYSETDSKGIAQFIVSDSGIGIPDDKKDFIFGKFNRLDPSYRGVYDGKGLGLSIVKEFLQEVGGQIDIESEVGGGSTFSVAIPYDISLFDKIEKVKANSKKILVVEDYPFVSRISKKLLESDNTVICTVDIANTGKEAIELCIRNKYDLILMDIGLPDMNGYDATKKIHSHKQSLNKKTKIVALTAHDNVIDECIEAGMSALISKPLRKENLKLVHVHLTN